MVRGLFSVSFQRGEGKIKKVFTREKSGHHVSDAIANCSYPVIFSKRGKNTSRVYGDESWLRCLCLISWVFMRRKQ